ncbi:MAG TPA: hypothetical protein VN040_24010, partial [Pseudosphingobacterium sp.]|nr:hypothetical protein [Pseudosphingobacterium sp.]
MMKIVHSFGVGTEWANDFAKQLGGELNGSFMELPESVFKGVSYVLNIHSAMSAWFLEGTYQQAVHFSIRHLTDDFISIVYNMSEGGAIRILNKEKQQVGRWNYNFSIMDSSLMNDYIVDEGTYAYTVAIFIHKEYILSFFKSVPALQEVLKSFYDTRKNTFIRLGRTSNQAWWVLQELKKQDVYGPGFDFFLTGSVWLLLAECIDDAKNREPVIAHVSADNLSRIIASQETLVNNVDKTFPGINVLAAEAYMSATKYKTLFKKITGLSANTFFLNNKLEVAKEMLE